MFSFRPKTLAAIVGAAVVALSASSASALPPLRFHQTGAVYSGNLCSPVMDQGAIALLTVVGAGSFASTSDVILGGVDYLVGTLTSHQSNVSLNAKGDGHIQDDRWKHKKYDKSADEDPPSNLPEPPTVWLFGAGLALMIALVLLRSRRTS